MRKLFSLFVALLATTALWAYDFQSDDLYYNITSDTIPYTAEVTYQYKSYINYSGLTEITIPSSVTHNDITYIVTSIGYQAFYYCDALTSVTIPNSVTSIENDAFKYCSALTSITIPNSVTSIGSSAFYDCPSLNSVTIGSGVTSIGDYAFDYSSSITSMVVEPGNTTYDSRENCNAIIEKATNTLIAGCQNTVIPNSVTSIGEWAFTGCRSLTSITIPESVTSIGEAAFAACNSLTSITIPNSVTSIGEAAFGTCISLTSMVVEPGNTTYDSRENCNAIIEKATNTLIAGCQNTVIPNSVTSIGEWAFDQCTSLTSITIPESVTSIGEMAFESCFSLTSITIPNSVTSIGGLAFGFCTSLTSVTLGSGVTSIRSNAFIYCSSLTSITCEATTPPVLELYVFPSELTTAYIPCGTKEAYEASDWAQYVSEFVEDCYSNQKCGDNLFWKYNDTQLSITGHGDMYDYDIEPQPWMQYRSKMQTISLPDGMTSIGASAFANCKYVKSIAIPASVEKISDSAFEDCRMLSTITFAGSSVLTHIGNWAFYNNHELTSITIPKGVIEIGYAAFYGCTYLDELTLPASMEYIADNGFALCAKLRRINVNASTPPVVEARTFEDVDRSIPVYVPNTSIELYKAAPVWQEFNIVGKNNTTTDVDNIHSPITNSHKLIRNGQFIILRDGKTYNVMGQEL